MTKAELTEQFERGYNAAAKRGKAALCCHISEYLSAYNKAPAK